MAASPSMPRTNNLHREDRECLRALFDATRRGEGGASGSHRFRLKERPTTDSCDLSHPQLKGGSLRVPKRVVEDLCRAGCLARDLEERQIVMITNTGIARALEDEDAERDQAPTIAKNVRWLLSALRLRPVPTTILSVIICAGFLTFHHREDILNHLTRQRPKKYEMFSRDPARVKLSLLLSTVGTGPRPPMSTEYATSDELRMNEVLRRVLRDEFLREEDVQIIVHDRVFEEKEAGAFLDEIQDVGALMGVRGYCLPPAERSGAVLLVMAVDFPDSPSAVAALAAQSAHVIGLRSVVEFDSLALALDTAERIEEFGKVMCGLVRASLGEYNSAAAILEPLVESRSEQIQVAVRTLLAVLHVKMRDYVGAKKYIDPVVGKDASFVPLLLVDCIVCRELGDFSRAIRSAEQATELDPGNHQALLILAETQLLGGRYTEETKSLYERALPGLESGKNRGLCLLRLDRYEEAEEELRTALRSVDDSLERAIILEALGASLWGMEKAADAVEALRQALRNEPDHPSSLMLLSRMLTTAGSPCEAVNFAKRAAELRPDTGAAQGVAGVTIGECGNQEEAIIYLRDAIRLQPDAAEWYAHLGVALMRHGDLEASAAAFEDGLQIERNPLLLYNYACVLCRLGDLSNALDSLEECIDKDGVSRELARADPDFDALRNDVTLAPRFKQAVK